ncbi:hypothetical protein Cgig2_012049 [Carnegiea gigantea]|uniref:NTF2 domain-containing protein n=1 Tax=Carnegiea gigantea TaxID=171969 RepID=A0A9Q1QN47_9CARY|nr:hypothetical protein Cgig2_012049 [Carnegiea gigantea]
MAAPGVQEQAAYAPPAEIVGNAFATQYYQILEQSPALVYRFYQNTSKLGRPDGTGAMGSTTTMDAINEKIQSYGSLKAEVKYVDAQESYNGGVIVLVIGSMINVDGSRRGFTQTFFLAPQDKGYYVLNDIFRYLEGDFYNSVKQDNDIAPATQSQAETSSVEENHVSEQSSGEVYDPPIPLNVEIPVEEEVDEQEEFEEEPVAEVVDEAPNESDVLAESNVKVEDVPKKSYASIVMKDTPATAGPPGLPESVLKTQEQQVLTVPAPSSVPVPPPSAAESVDEESNQEREGDGHSIYLKNLPVNISPALVEENFKRFGIIKRGDAVRSAIEVMLLYVSDTGDSVSFVAAAQVLSNFQPVFSVLGEGVGSSAIASPIVIGGREVVVEEKRSTNSRGSNRGRFPPGRGGGYRGEGGRGRGNYGGLRGYGRADCNRNDFGHSNRNDFGHRGGGRGFQNRSSEGYQRSDQAGNTTGRVNRGVGPGIGSARTQRVSA